MIRKCSVRSAIASLAAALFVLPSLASGTTLLLVPDRVFDGEAVHAGWVVVVEGERIAAAGPAGEVAAPAGAERIELPGATLLPGMIEGHTHLFLHPYDETA